MSPQPLSRRRVLSTALLGCGGLATAVCAPAQVDSGGRTGAVDVRTFRRRGDIDDSAAFDRAFASGNPVHAPAGGGSGPGGRYLVANDGTGTLPNGAELFGDGIDRTIIARSYRRRAPFIFHADSKSPDIARNIRGIRVSDLTFEDEVARRGFNEFDYLVMLSGVSDVRFDRVAFRGFRGDALHLGSSTISAVERHNVQVGVRDCLFDGVNANNRNAISVIDCDTLTIERCRFVNCTRTGDGTTAKGDPMNPLTGLGMPGPIDLEPNADRFAVIRNIAVRDNRFTGGGGYAVAVNLRPNDMVDRAQTGIVIADNVIENRWGALHTFGYGGTAPRANTRSYGVAFDRNTVRGCTKPFLIDGMVGLAMRRNVFTDCAQVAELGHTGTNRDIAIEHNRFERIGRESAGYGLWVRAIDGATISHNSFVDCGVAPRGPGIALALVGGPIRDLRIEANEFSSPSGRMSEAFTVFNGVAWDRRTVAAVENRIAFESPDGFARFGLAGRL